MILLFGDTQLQSDRPMVMKDWDISEGRPLGDKVSQMCKTAMWIKSIIDHHDPHTIIFLGDINETKISVSFSTIYLIKKFFGLLTLDKDRDYYSIIGNHDMDDPEGLSSSHVLLPEVFKTILPNEPLVRNGIALASYSMDPERYTESLKREEWNTLITHMSFKGMQFNTGFLDNQGVDLTDSVYKDKSMFLGHYHNPKTLTLENSFINVVGSPLYHDFRDEWGSERGVTLVTDEGEVLREENPYTKRYIKLNYPEEQDKLLEAVKLYGADNLNAKITTEKKYNSELQELGLSSIRFILPERKETVDRGKGISRDTSYKEDLSTYIGELETDLDKERLLLEGEEAVDKAIKELNSGR